MIDRPEVFRRSSFFKEGCVTSGLPSLVMYIYMSERCRLYSIGGNHPITGLLAISTVLSLHSDHEKLFEL